MKVGVLTRHAVANYGSVLQAYATQKAIEKTGHESEIINYIRKDEFDINISKTMLFRNKAWNSNLLRRIVYIILQTPVYTSTFRTFRKYTKRLLKETRRVYFTSEEIQNNTNYDLYCVGSDQVWGQIGCSEYDPCYFLDFARDGEKCISYASSFGKDSISESLRKELPKLLIKFDNISVRESSAKELLAELGICSHHVLDPTLLLTKKEWNEIADDNQKYHGYVLIYQLHDNKLLEKYAKDFANYIGKRLIRISNSFLYYFKSGKLCYMPSPERFLSLIKNADYVITDSFHATVFSLIFERKFVDILPTNTGTRIISLLKMLKLEDRIVTDYDDFSKLENEVNYINAKKILSEERRNSLFILKEMIEH
ncbi:polysaccharide pyruvyl transferase family protein [Butyrivibrio sp. JL13D10]|uniref:polysaccharide pyruvyl transferase family protein n=1 Tax=Butyrivibrio sp. JL13D10 TaxID=3236815 RepID=UPI0038B551A8